MRFELGMATLLAAEGLASPEGNPSERAWMRNRVIQAISKQQNFPSPRNLYNHNGHRDRQRELRARMMREHRDRLRKLSNKPQASQPKLFHGSGSPDLGILSSEANTEDKDPSSGKITWFREHILKSNKVRNRLRNAIRNKPRGVTATLTNRSPSFSEHKTAASGDSSSAALPDLGILNSKIPSKSTNENLLEASQKKASNSVEGSSTGGWPDLGILKPRETIIHHRLEDQSVQYSMDEYNARFIQRPMVYNIRNGCDEINRALEESDLSACNSCEVTDNYVPNKRLTTYNVDIDCPGINLTNDDFKYYFYGLDPLSREGLCRGTVLSDYQNGQITAQSCSLIYLGYSLGVVPEGSFTSPPMKNPIGRKWASYCTYRRVLGILEKEFFDDPKYMCGEECECKTCKITALSGSETGAPIEAYNLELNCPDVDSIEIGEFNFKALCNVEDFCQTCSVEDDSSGILVDMQNCSDPYYASINASDLVVPGSNIIVCPGQLVKNHCDCSDDCLDNPEWCSCEAAQECCKGQVADDDVMGDDIFGGIFNDDVNGNDFFGSIFNDDANGDDVFGSIFNDDANGDDVFGSIFNDDANGDDVFGNILNDNANGDDVFGNILNDNANGDDVFGSIFNDNANGDDVFGGISGFLSRPLAYLADYYCTSMEVYDACDICDVTDVVNPKTGLKTEAYNLKMDCPNTPESYTNFTVGLEEFCTRGVCEKCNVDYQNNVADLQNCTIYNLGDDLESIAKNITGIDWGNYMTSEYMDQGAIAGSEAWFEKSLIEIYCYSMEMNGDPCTTCEVTYVTDPNTGSPTEAFNVKIDCPNFSETTMIGNPLVLKRLMEGCPDFCESCSADFTNYFLDFTKCKSQNSSSSGAHSLVKKSTFAGVALLTMVTVSIFQAIVA